MSFWNELDTRTAEKTLSDERLMQDIQHLMIQVHQKFVDVDTAERSRQAVKLLQPAPQLVPQTAPSATAQPSPNPWAAAAARSRMSDTIPQGRVPTPQSEAPRAPSQETVTPRKYSVELHVGPTTGSWIWT